jgi:putative transposase
MLQAAKYSIAHAIGFMKGKSAACTMAGSGIVERRLTGFHFWSRVHCVSTVGLDEEFIRQYIREQEELERQQGTLGFQ